MTEKNPYERAILARLEAKAEDAYLWPRWPAAYEAGQAALEVADQETAELRAEVERLRSWLPRRIVEQLLLFGTPGEPRHEVGFTEGMRTYCTTCSARHQDWVTPDECPQFAEMDVPARVVPAARAEAAEADAALLRSETIDAYAALDRAEAESARLASVVAKVEGLARTPDGELEWSNQGRSGVSPTVSVHRIRAALASVAPDTATPGEAVLSAPRSAGGFIGGDVRRVTLPPDECLLRLVGRSVRCVRGDHNHSAASSADDNLGGESGE